LEIVFILNPEAELLLTGTNQQILQLYWLTFVIMLAVHSAKNSAKNLFRSSQSIAQ